MKFCFLSKHVPLNILTCQPKLHFVQYFPRVFEVQYFGLIYKHTIRVFFKKNNIDSERLQGQFRCVNTAMHHVYA